MSALISEPLFLARHEGLLAPENSQTGDLPDLVGQWVADWPRLFCVSRV